MTIHVLDQVFVIQTGAARKDLARPVWRAHRSLHFLRHSIGNHLSDRLCIARGVTAPRNGLARRPSARRAHSGETGRESRSWRNLGQRRSNLPSAMEHSDEHDGIICTPIESEILPRDQMAGLSAASCSQREIRSLSAWRLRHGPMKARSVSVRARRLKASTGLRFYAALAPSSASCADSHVSSATPKSRSTSASVFLTLVIASAGPL